MKSFFLDTDIEIKIGWLPDKKYLASFVNAWKIVTHLTEELIKSEDSEFQIFLSLYELNFGEGLLDPYRSFMLYQNHKATEFISGATAECGVYKGGTSKMIAEVTPNKTHYAMDTYSGFPEDIETGKDNLETAGYFKGTSLEKVVHLLRENRNVMVLQGKFEDKFPNMRDEIFSFVHVDADLYESVRQCCEFFYPRMSQGGIIVFDDYLFPETRGAKIAVDEFFLGKNEYPITLPTFQAVVNINTPLEQRR